MSAFFAAHPWLRQGLRRAATAAGLVVFLLAAWVATATVKTFFYYRSIGREPYHSSSLRIALKQVWATLLDPYYDWRLEHDGVLPTYRVELSDGRYAEWRQMLERVYGRGYSTPEDQVYLPARLSFHGREWEIDLRGRGTLYTHYRSEKPSMRVRFPGEQYLRGNRMINLVIPYDQARINIDTSISSLGRQYGLLTYPTRFVNVSLNGEMLGVYQEIEHFREELGVKQYRSEGFFMSGLGEMKGGAALEKNKRLAKAAQAIAACAKPVEKEGAAKKPAFEGANLIDLAHQGLGIQNAGACDEARIRELAELYLDLDKMAIYAAITSAFNAAHAWGEDNLILFFDPPRGRFEPVPWDMGSLWIDAKPGEGQEKLESLKGLGGQLMRLPEFREKRDYWLRDIVERKEAFMKREADRRYRQIQPALDYDTEHTRGYAQRMVNYFDQGISKNFGLWRGALAESGAAKDPDAAGPSLEERARLEVPPAALGKVKIENDDGGTTWALSGTIKIAETLALPEGIHVRFEPGLRLEMAGGTTFVIRGDLVSVGTPEKPIEVVGIDPAKPFNNFVVFGRSTRKARVVIEHTTFRNGSEGEWNSAYMTGMVSFYDASLRMSHSAIVDIRGEDGLNVKFGMVDIRDIVIDGAFSDALDCDFCTGVVENIVIKNGKADGLDVSGSLILSRGNRMEDLADKGHSVGENSAILILDNLAIHPFTGISVKDRSWAEIRGGKVVGAQIGISSYQKKPVFGGGVTGFEGRVEEGLTTRFMLDPNAWVTVLPPVATPPPR